MFIVVLLLQLLFSYWDASKFSFHFTNSVYHSVWAGFLKVWDWFWWNFGQKFRTLVWKMLVFEMVPRTEVFPLPFWLPYRIQLKLLTVLTDDRMKLRYCLVTWDPVFTGHGWDQSPAHLAFADVKLTGDTMFSHTPRPTSVSRSPTCVAVVAVVLNGRSQQATTATQIPLPHQQ